jgi:virginiamycin B lyase
LFGPSRLGAFAALAAVLLVAGCGKGTPLITGTATPAPPYQPSVTAEYPVPTASSHPKGIAVGADDGLWFTEFSSSKIGELTTLGTISSPEPLTPTRGAGPNGIASGPNTLLWFTETNIGKVGQITTGFPPVITEFALAPGARPTSITLGSDGNMWLTDPGLDAIWRVSQKGAIGGPCKLPARAVPAGITSNPIDGALWFTESGSDRIGRLPITQTGVCGTLTEYAVPTHNAGPGAIVSATDNALWFIESRSKKLGRITVSGQVTKEYSLAPAQTPDGLVQGIDGNFYFTDTAGNQIGRFVTKTGAVTLYRVPTANSAPAAMTLGPDNQVYFVETDGNRIGQFKYFCC